MRPIPRPRTTACSPMRISSPRRANTLAGAGQRHGWATIGHRSGAKLPGGNRIVQVILVGNHFGGVRRSLMGLAQENFVKAFCEAWGDGTFERKPDVERILSMMSEDAEWQLWVPGGPTIRGRGALRQEIHRQMRFATNNKCNIVNVLSSDTMV